MGHRVDPMGTRCPLHPISSLSHGGFSPGRERRHREEKRKAYRLGPMILVQKTNPRAHVSTHSRCTYAHKHTSCPAGGDGFDLPDAGKRAGEHMCVWTSEKELKSLK